MARTSVKIDLVADPVKLQSVMEKAIRTSVSAHRRLSAKGLDRVTAEDRETEGPHLWPGDYA